MKKRELLNGISVSLLALLLIIGGAWWLLRTPDAVSQSERRPLAGRPELTVKTLMSGEWMEDFETYSLDQFPLRDAFRTLKAWFHFDVYRQKDNNGIFLEEGHVFKQEYPIREASVEKAANKTINMYKNLIFIIILCKQCKIKTKFAIFAEMCLLENNV